jgi:hypothetical protein
MRRFVSLLAFCAALLLAYPVQAHNFPCGDWKDVLKKNVDNGYSLFGQGESADADFYIIMFVDLKNGDFIITGVDEKTHHACNMIEGQWFEFRKIVSM